MSGFTFACGLVAVAGLFSLLLKVLNANQPNLDAIPTVGHSGFPFFYIGAMRYLFNAKNVVQEGYDKFKGGSFKIAQMDRWVVVVCGTKLVDELRKAPNDVLSFEDALNDIIQAPFTLGPEVVQDLRRVPMILSQLTRNLDVLSPELQDEIVVAFGDLVPVFGKEWTKLPALETIMKIVTRVANRLFVGLPLCRDADFTELNIQFAIDVMKSAAVINLFPSYLKPFAGRFVGSVPASVKRGMGHLAPIVEKRLKNLEEHGKDLSMKPNDMISLLIDTAKPEQRTSRHVTQMLLALSSAVHTISMSLTHALFHLAVHPEVISPLREEVDAIVAKEGWTKAAVDKMDKVDSFLRESQRLSGLVALVMTRNALKSFTFSNGTHIPVGTTVVAAAASLHLDEDLYTNAETFNALRFSDMEEEDVKSGRHQMVSTGVDYIPFGHGKHACPGRFFAANELKAMIGHIVTSYDIKLENDGVRPADKWFANSCIPNPKAELMFRARQKPSTGI